MLPVHLQKLPQPPAQAWAHSTRLSEQIAREIGGGGGWLSFARFMELALHAPGLGYYSEGTFVLAMRTGKVGARPLHASMPWYFYGRMNDEDLKSIYAYLKTIKPVKHQLDNTEPPKFCRLCKQKHGFGATN